MKWKPYQAYKDSGVEWLAEVPKHWQVRRVSYFFSERREKVSDKDYQPLSVTKNGVVPQLENAAKTDDGDNRKLVLDGDFVINSRSDRKGSSGLSRLDGSVSLISTVLKPYNNIDGRFAHHLFRSYPFQEEFYRYGKGIVADLWSTNYSEMRNISLAAPDNDEQISISTFLDRETARLDTLISKQERLIELLQEKRQAIISHAVTKGLNPDVPMKDSGIEWLGEVPEGWQMTPMRFVSNLNPPVSFNEVKEEAELIFLPMDQIKNGFHLLNRAPLSNFNSSYNTFEKGDILLAKVTPCFENGNIAIAEDKGFGTSEIFVLRPTKIDQRFFYWYLQSEFFKMDGAASMTGAGGLKRVSSDVPQKHHIPKPPVNEQIAIATFLDRETSKIDLLIEKARQSIDLAKEHRTALISAAVTGKIDVREAA